MKVAINLLILGAEIRPDDRPRLERLKAFGFDAVEVPMFAGTPADYAELGRMLSDIGLAAGVAAIATPEANPISTDPAVRAAARERQHWLVDCTAALGGEVIAGPVHSPVGLFTGEAATEAERAWCVEAMQALADEAAGAGIRIAIEAVNRFECYLMSTIAEAAAICEAVGRDNFGILYDTFHANIEEKDPVATYERFHRQVNHYHVSENDRGIPGTGHVPFAAHFDAVRRSGYDGWMAIEAFSRAVPEIAGATRIWRDLFDSTDELYRRGAAFIREEWRAAGERVMAGR
ncbi:Xylose isomerase family protein [uncultured Pleomorphomonas sp.]|uniref:Xylose isomerase family protein n=1 Tax=uncultured Pleomorphomonas sp. TaxID=442121 RepID=A0A212LF72_9HYPH|nr:sugar phosphate isomerase/epimerase family protein [uncultured Pleomorphomonas sp.]SCM76128.1 Xylose isomerase family protein [uncultured Pleomorphomonas sp.]